MADHPPRTVMCPPARQISRPRMISIASKESTPEIPIMNTAHVLLRTGYADSEAASALAELQRTFGFSVQTIGLTSEIVVSMGGLKVVPDISLPAFEPESADILILPGGESWTSGAEPRVSEVVRAMVTLNRPVARFVLRLWPWPMLACSMIVCTRATVRTSSERMSVSIAVKNSIGPRQRCAIGVLSQEMVWPLLHSRLRFSGHWHLNENAISRHTRSYTREGYLTDKALRGDPIGR